MNISRHFCVYEVQNSKRLKDSFNKRPITKLSRVYGKNSNKLLEGLFNITTLKVGAYKTVGDEYQQNPKQRI